MLCIRHMRNTLFIIILLISSATLSKAQYGLEAYNLPGAILRIQTGYSFASTASTYAGSLRIYNADGMIQADTPWSQDLNTSSSIGFTVGTYIPVQRLGKVSMLALSTNINYNVFKWEKVADEIYGGTGLTLSGNTKQIAVPLSLDLKFGCDATLSKNNRFCATIGGGFQPAFFYTQIDGYSNSTAGVNPFLKVEVGLLAGLCMKFQAKYEFGLMKDFELINKVSTNLEDKNLAGSFSMTGEPAFTFSIILMPFSWAWQEHGWWDTYQLK